MKSVLLLLAVGLASSDKLDRTYLPPAGSKFAGGSPGDIEVPLEFPKETYATSGRPVSLGQRNRLITPEDSELTVGSHRGSEIPSGISVGAPQDSGSTTAAPISPFTYFQNSYKVPTTTTSYAFTQTTTFPPVERFETTLSPLTPTASGFPSSGNFGEIQQSNTGFLNYPQPSNQGQTFYQQINNQISPEFEQAGGLRRQRPGVVLEPGSNNQLLGFQPGISNGEKLDGRLNYNQPIPPQEFNRFDQGLRPSSTTGPVSENNNQGPGYLTQSPFEQNQSLNQHLGVQPPRQLVGQQTVFPSVLTPQIVQSNQPGTSTQYHKEFVNSQGTNAPSTNIHKLGTQYLPQSQLVNQQNAYPSTTQGGPSNYFSSTSNQYDEHLQNIMDATPPGSEMSQTGTNFESSFNQQVSGQPIQVIQNGRPGINPQPFNPQPTHESSYDQQFPGHQRPTGQGIQPAINNQPSQPSLGQQIPSWQIQTGQDRQPTIIGQPSQPLLGQQYLAQQLQTIQGNQPGTNIQLNQPALGQQYPSGSDDRRVPYQQFSSTISPQGPNLSGGDAQNIYAPDSTATSTILPPGFSNKSSYSSTTPSTFPAYVAASPENDYSLTTPVYSGGPNQENLSTRRNNFNHERPQAEYDRNAVILNYENVLTPDGFSYSFDTSNGIHADENGTAIDGVKSKGSYSYTGDDGKVYKVVYSADENGFRPHGDHLPTPPPVPEAIQRVIDQAVRDKEAGVSHDGTYDEAKYGYKKYQGGKNYPNLQDKIIINGADIPDDDDNRFNEPGNKKIEYGGDKRKQFATTGDNPYDNESENIDEMQLNTFDTDNNKNQRPSSTSFRRPSNRVPEQEDLDDDSNGNKRVIQSDKTRQKIGSITENKNQFAPGREDSSIRRPMFPGRKQNAGSGDNSKELRDETKDYINLPTKNINNNKIRLPSKQVGSKYIVSEDSSQDLPYNSGGQEPTITGKPKGTGLSSTKYDEISDSLGQTYNRGSRPLSQNRRPSGTQNSETQDNFKEDYPKTGINIQNQSLIRRPTINTRPNSSNTRFSESQNERRQKPGVYLPQEGLSDNSDGKKYDISNIRQKGQPATKQGTNLLENEFAFQKPDDQESGYQYTPPQNKFIQGETNRFPSRFIEIQKGSTRKPTTIQYRTSPEKGTTVQPFITPNVSRDDDDSYEDDVDQSFPLVKSGKITKDKVTSRPDSTQNKYETDTDDTGPEYYDQRIQENEEETLTSEKLRPKPEKTKLSSTQRPSYGQYQQTTIRPTNANKKQFTSSGNKDTQKGIIRPGQTAEYYTTDNTGDYYETSRPVQLDYSGKRIESSKSPGYNFVSSTTPMPSQASLSFEKTKPVGSYTQGITQYPTNNDESSDTSQSKDEYSDGTTVGGSTTSRPGTSRIPSYRPTAGPMREYFNRTRIPDSLIGRPGFPDHSFGRPTSRPAFNYSDRTVAPSISKGPSSKSTSQPASDYYDYTITPGSSGTMEFTRRPTTAPVTNYSDRDVNRPELDGTVRPGSSSRIPGRPNFSGGSQNLPSTTYRPNYAFNGKITQFKVKPNVTLDGFGKPVASDQTGKGFIGSTTYDPEYSVLNQDSGFPSIGPYQESGLQISSQFPGAGYEKPFRPSQNRFGKPELVSQGPSSGQQTIKLGLIQGQGDPSYVVPSNSPVSTERVIGEDFSGPKRPQSFDPDTGYYY